MKTIYKKLLFLFLILPISAVFSQTSLSGTVLDASVNQPLPGVNVIVQGANNSTTTDFDGKFQLNGLKNGDVIVVSYIGYQSESIKFSGQKTIVVSLKEDSTQLQEVIVQIGYGTVKKKDATGSVSTVTAKDFNKGAIVSADQLLNGKIAGVRITNNGGQPDSAPNIRIRGGASLNANSSPLIVIDGIPVDNTTPAGVSNPLSLINPNDIESFTVLKDASAAAIYGSRASNGVIIITTKRGTKGDTVKFTYSASVTGSKVGKKIDVMNAANYIKFIKEYHPGYTNSLGIDDPSTTVMDDPATEQIEGRLLYDTDWQNEIYRNAVSTDHNLSVSANIFNGVPFRASVGYTNNQGIVKTNDYRRTSASIKMTPSYFNDHLKIDINAKGIYSKKNAIDEGGALGGAINMDPTKPVYSPFANNIFGGYHQDFVLNPITGENTTALSGQYNPVALLMQRSRPEIAVRFLGNMEFDYKMHFLPELRAVVNVGLDSNKTSMDEIFGENSLATYRVSNTNANGYVFNPGRNYYERQTITNTTWDSYLAYAKDFTGLVKKFDIQGGYSYQNFKNDGNKEIYRYADGTGLREVAPNENNPNNRYYNELNLQSFFGRMNIDLANKYLFTLSYRTDGSSFFNKNTRWGSFPAAAFAWKLKEESFLANKDFVNDLKLRLGWGKTGQQDISGAVGFYPSIPVFSIGGGSSQYLEGSNLYSALPFNDKLTWEKTTTYNAGIDFDFFKNSFFSGSFDAYYRETTDLLAVVPSPPGQGLRDVFINNVGSTKSRGFELNTNFKPVSSNDFNLDVNANVAYTYVEITDLKGITTTPAGGSLPTGTNVNIAENVVGFQAGSFSVFQQLYDVSGAAIPGAFVDRNGDNQITNEDRYLVSVRPNWTFGFGFNMNYKNWNLSSSFRGQYGGQIYNARKLTSGWIDKAIPTNSSSLSNVLDFYSGAADSQFTNFNGNATFSDYFLEDATFVRCENIVLGYTFVKFIKSSSLKVYGALNNPFIITKYTGQDPENFGGIDNNFYPRPTSYTFGLTLDF